MAYLINAESTLAEVYLHNVPELTVADQENCLKRPLSSGVGGLTGCVTLVGVDLGDFLYDCSISDNCNE